MVEVGVEREDRVDDVGHRHRGAVAAAVGRQHREHVRPELGGVDVLVALAFVDQRPARVGAVEGRVLRRMLGEVLAGRRRGDRDLRRDHVHDAVVDELGGRVAGVVLPGDGEELVPDLRGVDEGGADAPVRRARPEPPISSWQAKFVGTLPWSEANTWPSAGTVMSICGGVVSATWAEAGPAARPAAATVAASTAREARGDIGGMQLQPGRAANRCVTLDLEWRADERLPVPAPAGRDAAAQRPHGVPRVGAHAAGVAGARRRPRPPARARGPRHPRGDARRRAGRGLLARGRRAAAARPVLALAARRPARPVAGARPARLPVDRRRVPRRPACRTR